MSPLQVINQAKIRLKRMESVKANNKPVNLKADISMVHGKKVVANNKSGFDKMSQKYSNWVKKMAVEK